jgi:hypothetical protein
MGVYCRRRATQRFRSRTVVICALYRPQTFVTPPDDVDPGQGLTHSKFAKKTSLNVLPQPIVANRAVYASDDCQSTMHGLRQTNLPTVSKQATNTTRGVKGTNDILWWMQYTLLNIRNNLVSWRRKDEERCEWLSGVQIWSGDRAGDEDSKRNRNCWRRGGCSKRVVNILRHTDRYYLHNSIDCLTPMFRFTRRVLFAIGTINVLLISHIFDFDKLQWVWFSTQIVII